MEPQPLDKLRLVNQQASTWIHLNCSNEPELHQCLKLQNYAKNYDAGHKRIRSSYKECRDLLSNRFWTPRETLDYKNCIQDLGLAYKALVDEFYVKFNN